MWGNGAQSTPSPATPSPSSMLGSAVSSSTPNDFHPSSQCLSKSLLGPDDYRTMCLLPSGMGMRNYLIEGVSGTGKTSVCRELQRRGYCAVNGDTDLAYQGDPDTGKPTDGVTHEHHIWHVDRVRALVADRQEPVAFFCGGSRNFSKFIDLFDGVFVLEVDLDTLNRRLDQRPEDEWGGKQTERELIVRLHQTKEDIPKNGIVIDATAPIAHVVDEIVRKAKQIN